MINYKEILETERKKYINQWKNNAQYYYNKGYYDWMHSHISKFNLILEVGCGNGLSTLTLLKNGHQVIVIDENIECLKQTKALLKNNNYNSKIIKREGSFKQDNKGYEYNYLKIKNSIEKNQILLIQGDILDDNNLETWLSNINIDCVLCWLIGTHGARNFNKRIAERNMQTATDYRIIVENNAFNMCNKILKPRAHLHLVDRGQIPNTDEEKNFYLQGYQKQMMLTSLEVEDIDFKSFEPCVSAGMTLIGNLDNKIVNNTQDATFISVLFRKL